MSTAQEAADEHDRQKRLAAERQRHDEKELERQREAQRRWEEQKRRGYAIVDHNCPNNINSQLKKPMAKENNIVYRFLQVFLWLSFRSYCSLSSSHIRGWTMTGKWVDACQPMGSSDPSMLQL